MKEKKFNRLDMCPRLTPNILPLLSYYMTDTEIKKLEKASDKEGLPISKLVRKIICEYLKSEKEKK